eukprot:COSAG02_NODE_1999_length_10148_cov_15.105483_5_plen_50_part_00
MRCGKTMPGDGGPSAQLYRGLAQRNENPGFAFRHCHNPQQQLFPPSYKL